MIFYFSATGNTRWAALRLSQALQEQLFFVPEQMEHPHAYTLRPGERLGFVFPVHGWRVPAFLREFISRLVIHAPATPYAYCLCTAGDSVGDTLSYLRQSIQHNASLRSLGVEDVSSAWSLIMPESYVGLPFMDVDKPEREREKKQRAAERLTGIVESIMERREGIVDVTRGPLPWMMSHVVGGFFERFLITDKPFHVVSDRCVRCGICANACPMHVIEGGHGSEPRWKQDGRCLTCFNCYHHCPHHAIEFGRRTRHKGQYYFK